MKKILSTVAALLTLTILNTFATAPTVSVNDVVVRQRWPWSRLVDIEYTLASDSDCFASITLTATNSGAAVALTPASLSGDIDSVAPGRRRIVWDPLAAGYTNTVFTSFSVNLAAKVWATYLIVDLNKTLGEEGQIDYRYETNFNPTTDDMYRTNKLVLRFVPAGTFLMGSPTNELNRGSTETQHPVTLSRGYYVGVFETTQWQWEKLMATRFSRPSFFTNLLYRETRPVESVSWCDIRAIPGTDTDGDAYTTETSLPGSGDINPTWPATHAVGADSFMGRLRALTGLDGFDLPTEAQWEYACRAGTTTMFFWGTSTSSAAYARYALTRSTDRNQDLTLGPAKVGSYLPNPWGIYDMAGNVNEWCLDRSALTGITAMTTLAVTDPVGPTDLGLNVPSITRGGCMQDGFGLVRSAFRSSIYDQRRVGGAFGFRVVLNIRK